MDSPKKTPNKCWYGLTKYGNCRRKSKVAARNARVVSACKYGVTRSNRCRRKPCLNGMAKDGACVFRANRLGKYGFSVKGAPKYHKDVLEPQHVFKDVKSNDIRTMFAKTGFFKVQPVSVAAKDERPTDVIVDPAGTAFIGNTAGASGVSGVLYRQFHIKSLDVPASAQVGHAYAAAYHGIHFIHAFGTNFNEFEWKKKTSDDALAELIHIYASIFREFCTKFTPPTALRLVAVSSGIFAGGFSQEMPELTAKAIKKAMALVPEIKRRQVYLRVPRGMYNALAPFFNLPTTQSLGDSGPAMGFIAEDTWNEMSK